MDGLDEPRRSPVNHRPIYRRHRQRCYPHLIAVALPGLLGRSAGLRYFRVGENGPRNALPTPLRPRPARQQGVPYRQRPLIAGVMRELPAAGAIPGGVNMLDAVRK